MTGICGYFNVLGDVDIAKMIAGLYTPLSSSVQTLKGENTLLTAIDYSSSVAELDGLQTAIYGNIDWIDPELQHLDHEHGAAIACIHGYKKYAQKFLEHLRGDFCLALINKPKQEIMLAVDRMGIQKLAYVEINGQLYFSSNLKSFAKLGLNLNIDPDAIYNYLFYHTIPSPLSIYAGVKKLKPGQSIILKSGKLTEQDYWKPCFAANKNFDFELEKTKLREKVEQGVKRSIPSESFGCFLSGGIDSSSVSGMAAKITGEKVDTFSMGFDQEGYDEIEYARIAVNHFGLNAHEYYVTPDDVADLIPLIASSFDEPFGNSSAVPAYYCAKLAKEHGVHTLLAGDGGDELFAGNERYAKMLVFEMYQKVPKLLRDGVLEPLLFGMFAKTNVGLIRKARSYIEQAKVMLPDRMQTYNFFLSEPNNKLLEARYIQQLDLDSPFKIMRETYNALGDISALHKMLYLDWKQTLADNDLRKVKTMCDMAGVAVRFPLLDDDLVAYSETVPGEIKMKNNKLRYFFKAGMEGFLPNEILYKTKQGFGLPFGVWLKTSPRLQEMAYDNLNAFVNRGYLKKEFIDWLIAKHRNDHAAYYGVTVWVIMMLELWLVQNIDRRVL